MIKRVVERGAALAAVRATAALAVNKLSRKAAEVGGNGVQAAAGTALPRLKDHVDEVGVKVSVGFLEGHAVEFLGTELYKK